MSVTKKKALKIKIEEIFRYIVVFSFSSLAGYFIYKPESLEVKAFTIITLLAGFISLFILCNNKIKSKLTSYIWRLKYKK